jgi:hypothetical protein
MLKKKDNGTYKFFDAFFSSGGPQFMITLLSIFETEWSVGRSIPWGAGLTARY